MCEKNGLKLIAVKSEKDISDFIAHINEFAEELVIKNMKSAKFIDYLLGVITLQDVRKCDISLGKYTDEELREIFEDIFAFLDFIINKSAEVEVYEIANNAKVIKKLFKNENKINNMV